MGSHSDFLTGASGRERREHLRRDVRLEAALLYLKKGLHGCQQQKAMAVNLSEGGCLIACQLPDVVSEHLYVIIAGIPGKIASAIVGRSKNSLNIRFGDKLPTALVDQIAKRHH